VCAAKVRFQTFALGQSSFLTCVALKMERLQLQTTAHRRQSAVTPAGLRRWALRYSWPTADSETDDTAV
jgi:hypothetical protein